MNDADPCTCFSTVPTPPKECNPTDRYLFINLPKWQKKLKDCKSAFGSCSRALKEGGPYVDQCKCDCLSMTTESLGRVRTKWLNKKWQ